ncbi:SMP-30/gluconolactonase/LRE family protein [Glaciecola petra]|uniref:SMP-30/gluconolactonase/LRE family protein n=1 Tax=Glaciecola petra TaxID=3075602 RepID=A0ABU2ZRY9_9ALTE|nr:SMP-30/gluconolactonase/LRE family protein [Aestuariibacter sp. P117]MDT0595390.1 SMP-30/gluconolactonase/LRE family protein [Aestuariibacter sp. P117]
MISPVRPINWQTDPMQDLNGDFTQNTLLNNAHVLYRQSIKAPEDVVVSPDGKVYTGLANGDIVRIDISRMDMSLSDRKQNDITSAEIIANTNGRPLGLKFDKRGNLIIADALKGLIKLSPNGNITVLASQFEGQDMLLVDYVDIAKSGDIYFSDASTRFKLETHLLDFIEASSTGRILKYSADTKQVSLVVDNLFFANGLALGPNDEYMIIAETGRARLLKHYLKGSKSGETEVFIDSLPAMPDNISYNGKDKFWVGLVTMRDWRIESLSEWPVVRRIIGAFPTKMFAPTDGYGFVISVNTQGEVVNNLQTPAKYTLITSAVEHDGKLIMGSLTNSGIAVYDLP